MYQRIIIFLSLFSIQVNADDIVSFIGNESNYIKNNIDKYITNKIYFCEDKVYLINSNKLKVINLKTDKVLFETIFNYTIQNSKVFCTDSDFYFLGKNYFSSFNIDQKNNDIKKSYEEKYKLNYANKEYIFNEDKSELFYFYQKILLEKYSQYTLVKNKNFYEIYGSINKYKKLKKAYPLGSKDSFNISTEGEIYISDKKIDLSSIKEIRENRDYDVDTAIRNMNYFISDKYKMIYVQTILGLETYDISNSKNLVLLGQTIDKYILPEDNDLIPFLTSVEEQYIYASLDKGSFNIVDIQDPKEPQVTFSLKVGARVESIVASYNEKYIAVLSMDNDDNYKKKSIYIFKIKGDGKAKLIQYIQSESSDLSMFFCNNDTELCTYSDIKDMQRYPIFNNLKNITINNQKYKSLYSFCKSLKYDEKVIKRLNPWINEDATNIPKNSIITILKRKE
jgi:hypothetical protein